MKKIVVPICKYVVFKCNYLNWNWKNSLLKDKRGRVGSLNIALCSILYADTAHLNLRYRAKRIFEYLIIMKTRVRQ